MAGNYPDVPSWRMAYDRDGTVCATIVNGIITQRTAAEMITLNDESDTGMAMGDGQCKLVFIFPETRDIDGYAFLGSTAALSVIVETSKNSTNGLDGTWTALGGAFAPSTAAASPNYRTTIRSATALGVRAIRFAWATSIWDKLSPKLVHLFGEITAGQSLDRLLLWHPVLDERVPPAYFDFGNAARSSSADRPFRVRNMSPLLNAQEVRVAMEALTDATPSTPAQHSLSIGGGSFLAQITVPSLAAGAVSDVITLRRITPSNSQLGLAAMRIFAEPASWS